ncbi:hypothetical protein [Zooshikella sp. RANM57]|uniref:hypothetical protein n=1 Tax=Zooshikella sp. RANM57 TaxID=3425863 RepID=UPI003D6DE4FC
MGWGEGIILNESVGKCNMEKNAYNIAYLARTICMIYNEGLVSPGVTQEKLKTMK